MAFKEITKTVTVPTYTCDICDKSYEYQAVRKCVLCAKDYCDQLGARCGPTEALELNPHSLDVCDEELIPRVCAECIRAANVKALCTHFVDLVKQAEERRSN